jgi:hypothetical protein
MATGGKACATAWARFCCCSSAVAAATVAASASASSTAAAVQAVAAVGLVPDRGRLFLVGIFFRRVFRFGLNKLLFNV